MAQLVDAILRDEKRMFTVSNRADSAYGVGTEVVLGLPCIIGKHGIESRLILPRSQNEQRQLEASATKLNEAYQAAFKRDSPNLRTVAWPPNLCYQLTMNTHASSGLLDVIIVGAGPTGLSAALILGRSLKQVLVIDSGKPRNAVSHSANGFFSRDGVPPSELLQLGREQLQKYETVRFQTGKVIEAKAFGQSEKLDRFQITLDTGEQFTTRKLLLATGVTDQLPAIAGFAELWGTGVFHCPYCHGWEVRNQPLAIYGKGGAGFEMMQHLTGWSRDLVFCSDGDSGLTNDQREQLSIWDIDLREDKIARLEQENGTLTGIVLTTGDVIPRRGIFVQPQPYQHSNLAKQLGCSFADNGAVQVSEDKQTSVPGIYAAGDTVTLFSSISIVASEGAMAGVFMNKALIAENLALEITLRQLR